MSRFLFLAFPHLCNRQQRVARANPSVAHSTGWCLPPAVTTSLPRGGTGRTAGATACRTAPTWWLSTAHRSRSFFIQNHLPRRVFLPQNCFHFSFALYFWAGVSRRLHDGGVGGHDWQRGRRKVDVGGWNAGELPAVRCLGRFLCGRSLLVPAGQLSSHRLSCLFLVVLQGSLGQGPAWWSVWRRRLRRTPRHDWFQRLKWLQVSSENPVDLWEEDAVTTKMEIKPKRRKE